jgi:hypothetical protein
MGMKDGLVVDSIGSQGRSGMEARNPTKFFGKFSEGTIADNFRSKRILRASRLQ